MTPTVWQGKSLFRAQESALRSHFKSNQCLINHGPSLQGGSGDQSAIFQGVHWLLVSGSEAEACLIELAGPHPWGGFHLVLNVTDKWLEDTSTYAAGSLGANWTLEMQNKTLYFASFPWHGFVMHFEEIGANKQQCWKNTEKKVSLKEFNSFIQI